MFLIFKTIVLFAIFGNSVYDCIEIIGKYNNLNDKSCGISLFTSEPKLCFKYHNELPLKLKDSRNALLGESPWSVLIKGFRNRYTYCGGVIVSEWWVLTSARCLTFDDGTKLSSGFNVFENPTKEYKYLTHGTSYTVSQPNLHIHPKFNRSNWSTSYDVGLLKLDDPIPTKPGTVNSVCLPPQRNFTYIEEEYAMISGWFYPNDKMRLKIANIKVSTDTPFIEELLGKKTSNKGNNFIWPGHIFGRSLDKERICVADFGSPVWQYHLGRAVLIGILSGAHINYISNPQKPDEFTDCQYEVYNKYYAVPQNSSYGYMITQLNVTERLSYITWVPMMMDWILNVTQNY